MAETFPAHVRQAADGTFRVQTVREHAEGVASLAAEFAEAFGTAEWSRLGGLWHDLGKYHPEFVHRIKSLSGYDPDAHLEGLPGKPDHATLGAIHALEQLGPAGRVLAYPIAGHHTGLPDWEGGKAQGGTLRSREKRQRSRYEDLPLENMGPEGLPEATIPEDHPPGGSRALWIRMLFSCLVDADRLDTERFMAPEKAAVRTGRPPTLRQLKEALDSHLRGLTAKAAPTKVNRLRGEVLEACREAASWESGLFSLSVPTGGGKTLSSLAWALEHALAHGLEGVFYVIPFTSIIEQSAEVFREALQFPDAVLEHHSNLDPDEVTPTAALASENWDAPLVVTTGVQFWESLFSHKPGRARRIHRVARSVVVLDEAHTVPPHYLEPILSVVRDLSSHYRASFLLCTATQPAFRPRPDFERPFSGLENVREIIPQPIDLSRRLKRVDIEIPDDLHTPIGWEELARDLGRFDTVLCIVSRRDDARTVYELLPEESREHLSALMCGEHRSDRIRAIKEKLAREEPVRVVSTQLIEAGVDIDFPVVFRALSGIDSIAQAAGRCNREGTLGGLGKVKVFVPPDAAPPGLLRQAADTARTILDDGAQGPLHPDTVERFFAELYWKQGERLDKHGILDLLDDHGVLEIAFRSAGERFRIIESAYEPIVVRYENDELLDELERFEPGREMRRRLQRFVVTVPAHIHTDLAAHREIEEMWEGLWVQVGDQLYDDDVGLLPRTDAVFDPPDLIG